MEFILCDLDNIVAWCKRKKLCLNISKCPAIRFFYSKTNVAYNCIINDVILNSMANIRNFGVIFLSDLSFSKHTLSFSSATFRMLGFIERSSKHFSNVNVH